MLYRTRTESPHTVQLRTDPYEISWNPWEVSRLKRVNGRTASPSYQRSHAGRQRVLQAWGECLNCVHEAQQVMFCTECRPQGHMSCCRTSFHAWMKLEIRASNPGSAYCLLDIPWTGETMKWCDKNRHYSLTSLNARFRRPFHHQWKSMTMRLAWQVVRIGETKN